MAKILKHFGLGNKKSTTSPAHKCKIDNSVDSPQLSRSTTAKEQILTSSDGSPSANSPSSPSKSPFDYPQRNYPLPTADREDQDLVMNLSGGGRTPASPPDSGHQQPVYSAVIKERITPDSILSEIASKLSVSEEKTGDKLSTFGKNSKATEANNSEAKKPTAADRTNVSEKLPDIIKADVTGENRVMEYDDPYEEGPIKVSQQLDSGLSSLMSSSTTLNQVRNSDDTLEKKSQSTCVGETQIGFETLKSWSSDRKSKGDEDGEESDNTLEGKDIHPPPIPAKTYNLANELPPPPPNLLQDGDLAEGQAVQAQGVGRAPRPLPPVQPLPRAGVPPHEDQPWDLSAKTPVNKSDTWSNGRRYEEDMLAMPSGPAPEPPMRESWRCDAPRGSADVRSRHESLMMRSAYGLEASNYPQGQYYYPHQQMGPSPQVRHHYRSGSVRSVDYRPGIEYDEPWDQQHPFFCQTGSMPPDSMRCSYQMMPRQYSSRASSSSWIHSMGPEKIDPRIPLEEQFWFHGTISRVEAENILRMHREGGFLVRMSESNRFDFSLSLKSARGFMHMKIVTNPDGRYILGQFSQPFSSIPHMIHHYTIHKLPIKGAEHMSLVYPVGIELL